MFLIGIDIAKRNHEAVIITEDGQIVRKPFSFRNNCTGYNQLLEQARKQTRVGHSHLLCRVKLPQIIGTEQGPATPKGADSGWCVGLEQQSCLAA